MSRDCYVSINKEQPISMVRDQVLSLRGKHISIECLSGSIWITWTNGPNGHERTLQEGQSCSIASKGKVCLATFKTARIKIQIHMKHGRFLKKNGTMATLLPGDQSPALLPWTFV